MPRERIPQLNPLLEMGSSVVLAGKSLNLNIHPRRIIRGLVWIELPEARYLIFVMGSPDESAACDYGG